MTAKVTKVKLVCPTHNLTEELEIKHAERLLRMPNNGGWQLPDDSDFKFTQNGIEYRRNKKADNGAEETPNNQ